MGDAGKNSREQDDGNAVADAELRDLPAHPHDKGGARDEGHDDDQRGPDAGVGQNRSASWRYSVSKAPQIAMATVAYRVMDWIFFRPSRRCLGQPSSRAGMATSGWTDDELSYMAGYQGEDCRLGKRAAAHHIIVQAQACADWLLRYSASAS